MSSLYVVPAAGPKSLDDKGAVQCTKSVLWRRFKDCLGVSRKDQRIRATVEVLGKRGELVDQKTCTATAGKLFNEYVDKPGRFVVTRGKGKNQQCTFYNVKIPTVRVIPDLEKRPERKHQKPSQQRTGDLLRLAARAVNPAAGPFQAK